MDDVGENRIAPAQQYQAAANPQHRDQYNGHRNLHGFLRPNNATKNQNVPETIFRKNGTAENPVRLNCRNQKWQREAAMWSRSFSFTGWTWSAVIAGVVASLVFQVLLSMAGFGFGLLTIDVPTADNAPKAVTWAVFAWWGVSGVISAFVGGWVAANFSDSFTTEGRATHALMAWAVATLIVVGATAMAGSNSIAGNLSGPTGTALAQYRSFTEPGLRAAGPARPSQAQLETARRNLALVMLGSFVALILGAGAAIAGSQWLPEEKLRTTRPLG
jgi:hypothetical protein